MELRVPGSGGPSPESVLGCPPNHAVPTWLSESWSRSMVRHAADDDSDVHVYDWRPLTSGSRSFAVWPLLAPFTLVNIAGWMGPPDGVRGWLHRWVGVVLGVLVTVQCVVWLVVVGVDGWTVFLGSDSTRGAFWAGLATAIVAMGLLVTGATYMASGFERYRPGSWGPQPAEGSTWGHPWGPGITMTTADERFFDNAREHRVHWYVHVVIAVAAMVATVTLALVGGGAADPWIGLDRAMVAAGGAPLASIGVLVVIALVPDTTRRPITTSRRPRRTRPGGDHRFRQGAGVAAPVFAAHRWARWCRRATGSGNPGRSGRAACVPVAGRGGGHARHRAGSQHSRCFSFSEFANGAPGRRRIRYVRMSENRTPLASVFTRVLAAAADRDLWWGDSDDPAEQDGIHVDLKLAGNELANFSAFLLPEWRANDWMWGQLDAVPTWSTSS